ncbi:hypothetical protein BKP64_11085 [Marinobacter salinus]|uniref:Lipoprotein n=1 Tax=Marinobacter salinus TaxID=1874317 RepID=A0A1D9GM00_9GAMM|nr:J517_1871 family lipoprotein [Marinobacter salinus]AOY88672.1 hypothetical protein BKP64_11085 [Marinobacter salinus]
MKTLKTVAGFTCALLVVGCQTPLDHMQNNNFVQVKPETIPKEMVGLWSGNMGPYLVSMRWEQDGYGLFCYSYGSADVLQRIKYSSAQIHIQDGTKLEVEAFSQSDLTLRSPYFGSTKSVLLSDPTLKEASLFCSEKLQSKQ